MSDTPAEQLRRRWYMAETAETRQSAAMFAANELDRLQSLADELAAALRKSEQYIVLALIEGRKDRISQDTLQLAENDLEQARAALAKYDEVKS